MSQQENNTQSGGAQTKRDTTNWTEHDNRLTWRLLDLMEQTENHKVLFGTVKDVSTSVFS